MVDARIRELSSREDDRREPAVVMPARAGAFDRRDQMEFAAMVDDILAQISHNVLAISEQAARDYARLEQDLLQSRLMLLKSAEMVLDMALSLKKQARQFFSSGAAAERQVAPAREIDRRRLDNELEARGADSRRPRRRFDDHPPYARDDRPLERRETRTRDQWSSTTLDSWNADDGEDGEAARGRASMYANGVADLFRKT
jgi:hypothetical protein